jgi:hypothetical protein
MLTVCKPCYVLYLMLCAVGTNPVDDGAYWGGSTKNELAFFNFFLLDNVPQSFRSVLKFKSPYNILKTWTIF